MLKTIDEFVAWKRSSKPKVWRYYQRWLGDFYSFIQKPIGEITLADITAYSENLKTRLNPRNGKPYDPRTTQYVMTYLKHFFSYCEKLGYSKVPPILIQVERAKEKIPEVLSFEEYRALLGKIPVNTWAGLRNNLIMHLLFDCALRVSELVNLDISQLDLVNQRARIKVSKSHEEHYIFWSEETNELLKRYLGIRKEIQVNSDALFIGKGGYKFYAARLTTRSVERFLKEYGIKPHMLRHSKVHNMYSQGAGIHEVHYILRHSMGNLNSALQYSKMWGQEAEKSAKKYL